MNKKSQINYTKIFDSYEEYERKALEVMHNHDTIRKIILDLSITDEEILDNLLSFINLKDSYDNKKVYPYEYELSRNKTNKLVFKKRKAKNDYNFVVTREINLWLTDISKVNPEARCSKMRLSTDGRRMIETKINVLKNNLKTNLEQTLQGFYIYGGNKDKGKTFISNAAANEWAAAGISTVYMNVNTLFSFLISNFKNNYVNADVINKMKEAKVLIFDDLGMEKNNKWFKLDILLDIISDRLENKKITCFASPLSPSELEEQYMKDLKDEPYKARSLISRILKSTEHYNID